MEPLVRHTGLVVPMERANIDTDQIIPKQFLKRVERSGFGEFLFFDWRYRQDQSPNPEFVLNQPQYQGASILVAGPNFGCGSSREHAPWALNDYGFRVIISSSFADIFYQNCLKNGMLPLILTPPEVGVIMHRSQHSALTLTVDLEALRVFDSKRTIDFGFALTPYQQDTLMHGLDDIARTLAHESAISAYETQRA
ncbi:MAG: 3-isopropylmalate dehydratase small subunit [Firmicutes bacterium]|jgi:3-isopropylmalate/(R)-2-methylmalate dehydratase small subunit|nr:3-isopropylmalate dehydratase small subunit [Bacillota bacterium]